MSKYFDETLRARSSASPEAHLKLFGAENPLKSSISEDFPGEGLGLSRLENCRKLSIPLANMMKSSFMGSEALQSAEEAYRALRTRLSRIRSTQGIRSFVLTSAIAGEGKTLTALNLALCCAQLHNMRILLIDADIRTGGLARRIGCHMGQGLAEVLSGECTPEEAILATDIPGLFVLGSGSSSTAPAELFASGKWQEFIGWCNESFKLILVDCPPMLDLSDVELISAACDGVLIVVRARYSKRDILQRCAAQLDQKKILGVVYNGVHRPLRHSYYEAYLGGGRDA